MDFSPRFASAYKVVQDTRGWTLSQRQRTLGGVIAADVRHRLLLPRWQLAACSSMHAVNDALFAGLYPLLPLMALDLGLSYGEVGAIKTAYSGASAVLQIPGGVLAERMGEQLALALGTGWVAIGMIGMGVVSSFWLLLVVSALAGVGGNIQHPAAASVVSRLYEHGRRGTAIGTLNFSGDLGKMLAPAIAGTAALALGWRGGLLVLGVASLAFAVLYAFLVPQPALEVEGTSKTSEKAVDTSEALTASGGRPVGTWGITHPLAFAALLCVGMLDSAARGTALTFLPFVLADRGADPSATSISFGVLFAAGAAGKFLCGPFGDRYGAILTIALSELLTAASLGGLLVTPLALAPVVLLPLGFVLNGTSSVLYASVAGLVAPERRSRGYGLYYTGTQVASALFPILYGMLADGVGLTMAFATLAVVTAAIAPLSLTMRTRHAA
ncbi:MAG: MFS transporter [Chloroflexota bacterium]